MRCRLPAVKGTEGINNIPSVPFTNTGVLVGLRFHNLRHDATSLLFERGRKTHGFCGHHGAHDPANTKRYTHLRTEDLVILQGWDLVQIAAGFSWWRRRSAAPATGAVCGQFTGGFYGIRPRGTSACRCASALRIWLRRRADSWSRRKGATPVAAFYSQTKQTPGCKTVPRMQGVARLLSSRKANGGADPIEQIRFLRHGVIPLWILAYNNVQC